MPTVEAIYTDGACSGNPGPGGWGTRIEFDDGQVHELGGRDQATTNNRMEMQAAIAALEFLVDADTERNSPQERLSHRVTLHTDSEYLKNGITKWIKGWKKKGWKTSAGKPVLNKDLWQQLDKLTQSLSSEDLTIDWRYVRGHAGNPGNERCDEIARAFSHSNPISLKQYSQSMAQTVSSTANKPATKTDDKEAIDKEKSIGVPKINSVTQAAPSSAPTLEFNDATHAEGTKNMVTAAEKQTDKYLNSQGISRIDRLQNTLKTLQVTDELAQQGYLITSAELADLMDVNASAVTSRGDYWAWRNWTVSRIRREGNQILWQLERIDE
ncbi:MAG: ribonuclease HI [Cyanobacteria bacterium P01_D01_bin.105]